MKFNQATGMNNTIYLVWMQAVAALHSRQLGLTFQDFVELGYGCVARQHHMEYKRPTFAGDTLWVATWISHNEGLANPDYRKRVALLMA